MKYIHQREDWPGFKWSDEELAAPLGAVRHRQGRLLGRMEALGFSLREEAVLQALTEDVIKSSDIEGETLDRGQVRSSIARRLGVEIGGLAEADREVEGAVEVILDATRNYSSPLTAERLKRWHSALFPWGRSGMKNLIVGEWRDDALGPMQVVSGPLGRERVHFEAPEARLLDLEIGRFLQWFENEKTDPVLTAGIAHLWFITIHPFDDGNGRLARAISDLALARAEATPYRFYSMSAQIRAERQTYYDLLEQTQKGDLEITPWMLWFIACLDRAIVGAEAAMAKVLTKARFWQAVSDQPLNDRQRKVLNQLLDGFQGKLTNAKWVALTRSSSDTALRDISDLIKRGILVRESKGGRSTSYQFHPDYR